MTPLILAWALFAVGAVSSTAFTGLYLADVKPWRRRPGEDIRVRRVRRMILSWAGGLSLLYLSSAIGLLTLHTHPSTDPGRMGISAAIDFLAVNQLVVYITVQRRDQP